jgi:hypothetical protein
MDAVPPERAAESCGPALADVSGGRHLSMADVSPDVFLGVVRGGA